jgi:anaerobic selenocysteine-containing dehydrogenase
MLVTVQAGRATRVAGDPEHPITAGFLCGKVSNYLDRVYAEDRLLEPLIRSGPKGEGRFRHASWDEALDVAADGLREAISAHGGETVLPYFYLGASGFLQHHSMSARFFNALGASDLVRTICADAGGAGVAATHGISPEVDPERWPKARYVLCWGWNPMSTAPHLWRQILAARRAGARLVVVDPYRSRTARVADEHLRPRPGTDAALALGMMRAIVDAGVHDEQWCRAHTTGYEDLLERLGEYPLDRCAALCGVPAEAIARVGREFATTQPSLLRLGIGGQRHMGAPIAYRTIACLPALAGSWRHEGGGCSYAPVATIVAVAAGEAAMRRPDLRPAPVRSINMSQLGRALTDSTVDPPVTALVCWNSNPAMIAPDQNQVLAGLRRRDLFTVVLEQFMTDTARHADVVLPATTQLEHLDAVWSWGHHYVGLNTPAIAPRGQAKPNTEIFRLLAARMGLDDPCFHASDDDLLAELFASEPGGVELSALRERGWVKIDLGQGPAPHAQGGFSTPDGKLAFRADWLAERGLDPLPCYDPPAELDDTDLARRFPLALVTPKSHLFLNTTFANQSRQHGAQPAPYVVMHPHDAAARAIRDGDRIRIYNDRGAFEVRARVSDDTPPSVLVAPMGWWRHDYAGRATSQVTTSQRLTTLGQAPTFNDNRVEAKPIERFTEHPGARH